MHAFRARLAHYTFLMCGHREDAEEVAQETLMRVFESIDQLRDPARLKSWVFRIAKNECLMKRRKSVFAPSSSSLSTTSSPTRSRTAAESRSPTGPRYPTTSCSTRNCGRADRGIQSLPETTAPSCSCAMSKSCRTEETAEILDVSADTVKTRLHRGRLALRKYLDAYLRAEVSR